MAFNPYGMGANQPFNPYQNYGMGMNNGFQNQYIPQPDVQANTLIKVNGLEGAKAYQMPPNSTVALFDGNEDIFYIKTTDGAGFPTITPYSFVKHETTHPKQTDFVSREEYNALLQEIENIKVNYGKLTIPE